MIKYSIKKQIFLWVSFIIVIVVVLNIIFNNFFLNKIYLVNQKNEIVNIYNLLQKENLSKEELNYIHMQCNIKNIVLFVTDSEFNPIIYNYYDYGQIAKENLIEYIKNYEIDSSKIIENKDLYTISISKDSFNFENMELIAKIKNGNNILIRISIDSINNSVQMFDNISSIVLLLGLGIGIYLSWFLCKKISNPIKELTNISEQMIKFNFDSKYNFEANNEIDILGKNFNNLSEELNNTLNELKEANNQLEKDIEEKIKIDNFRKEFISNVSHELKTPIALIQGYAEAIKEGISDDKETNDYYLDIIVDESIRMNKLVKQLIDLSKLESNASPIELKEFNICELINNILNNHMGLIKEKDVTLNLNYEKDEIIVISDEFKIEQVVINYITNALNHIDFEKELKIDVFYENDNVIVQVFNSGKLIPIEDIENIWIKFYKVDKARTRAYGGSGIGLSIVQAIINSLGQDFGVENKENGVMFWFSVKKK